MSNKRYPRAMITTALIPWNEDFSFDEQLFRKQIRHIVAGGIKHIYIFGTAGEGYDINTLEYVQIVRAFYEEMSAPDLHPMVCIITLSTRLALERIQVAYDIGIREFQLTLPSWGVLSDAEMMRYYHTICDPYPDCAFMIYNIGRCGKVLDVPQFEMIAAEFPNIVAVKHTLPSTVNIDGVLRSGSPLQFILHETGLAHAAHIGECGYLVAIAAPNPAIARDYFEAGINKDYDKLFKYENMLFDIMRHLIKVTGVGMDGAYDKMTLKLAIPEFPLRLRPPYNYPSDEDFARHRDYIKAKYPDFLV